MHTDFVDLNIRPRGIVPSWCLLSIMAVVLKLIGLPVSWWLVAAVPLVGIAILNLFLVYGILEALQKDLLHMWRRATDKDYRDENLCPTCNLPMEEE